MYRRGRKNEERKKRRSLIFHQFIRRVKDDCDNYRRIPGTSLIIRLYERILRDLLENIWMKRNILVLDLEDFDLTMYSD